MIYFIAILMFTFFDVTNSRNNMNFSYILFKSCMFAFVVFISMLSGEYFEFMEVLMLSVAVIVVNFFVCLLVNFVLFILYKVKKLTNISIVVSFLLGYLLVFHIIECIKYG